MLAKDLPSMLVLDLSAEINEFLMVVRSGIENSKHDRMVVEEIIASCSYALSFFTDYQVEIRKVVRYYLYDADSLSGKVSPALFAEAVGVLGHQIVSKIIQLNGYVNGTFPYTFNRLLPNDSVVFAMAEEFFSERYLEARIVTMNSDQNEWEI